MSDLRRSAVTKNEVLVHTRLAEGLLPVQGDRVQLQQVILNLLLNAAEAMGAVEAGSTAAAHLWLPGIYTLPEFIWGISGYNRSTGG
jgi:C4-dicarboxylate-specific signal transduction histidine kinase